MGERFTALLLVPAFLSACAGPVSRELAPQRPAWKGAVSIVPQPAVLHVLRGAAYVWQSGVTIEARNEPERNAAGFLRRFLALQHVRSRIGGPTSSVVIERFARAQPELGAEGYRLHADAHGIAIGANTAAGLFYGVQTLEQLSAAGRPSIVAPVEIVDRPRFAWRGIHLDVSRHFFGIDVVERFIDIAAHYKLNVFHWHLTDDQAWRIQIENYPRLTASGPFYTQAQIREVVRYAAQRNVTIVPEIEMPAHSAAARRAYPFTLAFLKNVLTQVSQLFPGRYIHIGGDEVLYSAQPSELMRTVARFIESRGRRAVAWDDILAAHPPRPVVIMAWHGEKSVRRALASGYEVIAAPDGPLYFDAYQGARAQEPPAAPHMSTLEQVYAFNPQPDGAPAGVLGAQANVWTERISTAGHLFYMVLPRELALAEVVWDVPQAKNWNSFLARLPAQLAFLAARGYEFRAPNVLFTIQAPHIAFAPVAGDPQAAMAYTKAATVTVRLSGAGTMYYTTDGSVPTRFSTRYLHPFVVALPAGGQVSVRAAGLHVYGERRSGITACILTRTEPPVSRARYSQTWAGLVSP